MRSIHAVLTVAAFPAAAFAGDLAVPAQYGTIDGALAHAQAGDRVVVSGGRWPVLEVTTPGVEVVGRGATLAGATIAAEGVALRNFRIAGRGTVDVDGYAAVVTGLSSPSAKGWNLFVNRGNARIERNSFRRGGVTVRSGLGTVVRSNRSLAGGMETAEDGTVFDSNQARSILVRHADGVTVRANRMRDLMVYGDRTVIVGNTARFEIFVEGSGTGIEGNHVSGLGIGTVGDDTTIRDNTVDRAFLGVYARGNRADVSGNSITVSRRFTPPASGGIFCDAVSANFAAIVVESTAPGGTVSGNRITHTGGSGVTLTMSNATVADNTVHGVSPSTSLTVVGSSNAVSNNVVTQSDTSSSTGNGIEVSGDANVLTDNQVTGAAADAIAIYAGSGNALTGNVVADGGRCGIDVGASATGTSIDAATVTGGGLGIVNAGSGTSVTGSTMTQSRWADVLDLAGFHVFDGNTFGTLSHDAWLAPNR